VETRGRDRAPVDILVHRGSAFRGSKGQDFQSIRSLKNVRGNLNHPFLGRMAAIERYREKSRKENRQSGNCESGYRGSRAQGVYAFWHCDVQNLDRRQGYGPVR
jgi:hypothetical protein